MFKVYNLVIHNMLVTQSCPALCNPVDCSLLGYFAHGILQARILEWVSISFSRGSSQPGIRPKSLMSPGWIFNLY